jgi:hypothetical protein
MQLEQVLTITLDRVINCCNISQREEQSEEVARNYGRIFDQEMERANGLRGGIIDDDDNCGDDDFRVFKVPLKIIVLYLN